MMSESLVERRHVRAMRSRSRSRSRASSIGMDEGGFRRSPSVSSMPGSLHKDAGGRYEEIISRSFTPTRELIRARSVSYSRSYEPDLEFPKTRLSYTPRSSYAASLFYNPTFALEEQPLRKYDVFSLRTWSYPIWKHLHEPTRRLRPLRDHYATAYTPPLMATDYRPAYMPSRRGYSGFSYLADENSFDLVAAGSRSRQSYQRYYHSPISPTPWYRRYYGHSDLRHFGGYRPRYISSYIKPLWLH